MKSIGIIDNIRLEKSLKDLKRGKLEKLSLIYDMMYKPLFLYTFSITKNYHFSEDIVQDVFIRIERYADKYNENTNPKAWIYMICKFFGKTI